MPATPESQSPNQQREVQRTAPHLLGYEDLQVSVGTNPFVARMGNAGCGRHDSAMLRPALSDGGRVRIRQPLGLSRTNG